MATNVRIQDVPSLGSRRLRTPQHRWAIRQEAFQITPFAIAPVLPGETMKNLDWQSRVVSDPLNSPLVGWWKEYYWFYVKLRDLAGRDDFTAMLMDIDKDMSSYNDAATTEWYHGWNTINWAKECCQRVT